MTPPTDTFDVDCYVRTSAASGAADDIVEALRTHSREGRLNSLSVHAWPTSVTLDGSIHRDVLETVREFREWAADHDASLEPTFSVEERVSEITGERERRLRLPVVCLAVYEEGDLYCVVPNRTADRTCTVPKALEIVEANEAAEMAPLADATDLGSSIPS